MKLSTKKLLEINAGVTCVIDQPVKELPTVFKFRLLGIKKSLEPHVANFNMIRDDLVRKYGKKSEDGMTYLNDKEDPEEFKKFSKELDDILSVETEVDICKIKAEEVFDLQIASDDLVKMYDVLEM